MSTLTGITRGGAFWTPAKAPGPRNGMIWPCSMPWISSLN